MPLYEIYVNYLGKRLLTETIEITDEYQANLYAYSRAMDYFNLNEDTSKYPTFSEYIHALFEIHKYLHVYKSNKCLKLGRTINEDNEILQ